METLLVFQSQKLTQSKNNTAEAAKFWIYPAKLIAQPDRPSSNCVYELFWDENFDK